MKIKVHAKSWIVLQAETISEGVNLGILQEHLMATGRDLKVMGGDTMEIPLADIDEIRFAKQNKKRK